MTCHAGQLAAAATALALYLYEEAHEPLVLAALLVSVGDQITLLAAADEACLAPP